MGVSNLFKLIRQEEVCLWIGSGFSLYAGYPSATEVRNILFESLTKDEQKSIEVHLPLSNFAEDFVRLKNGSRSELLQILHKEYRKKPIATDLHNQLSFIPHFKSIITTNYDSLIEDSYLHRAIILKNAKDIPLINNNLVKIYKVHGDLNNSELIITSHDYSKFNNLDFKDPYWSSVLTELSTKNILFLGYGFEDPNFWAFFDNIDKHLANNRKERFLIAPKLNNLKQGELVRKFIEYIDMDGEQFINDLTTNLKENIVSDFENKKVSTDTFSSYMSHHDLKVSIEVQKNKLNKLKSLEKLNGYTHGKFHFVTNEKTQKLIENFAKGNAGRLLEVPQSEINSFETFIEGFKVNSNLDSIDKIFIKYLPSIKKNYSIMFDEVEFENLEFEAYKFNDRIEITTSINDFNFEIIFPIGKYKETGSKINIDFKFNITEPSLQLTIIKYIEVYKFCYNLFKSEEFKIFIKEIPKPFIFKIKDKTGEKNYFYKLRLYEALQKIERFFKIKFTDFKLVNNNSILIINQLISLIDNGYYIYNYENGITINDAPTDYLKKVSPIPKDSSLLLQSSKLESVELLGATIELGTRDIFISKIDIKTIDGKLNLKSMDNTYIIRYSVTGLTEIPPELEIIA